MVVRTLQDSTQKKKGRPTMGLAFYRIWERMFGKKEMRILMVGLDGHVLCGN